MRARVAALREAYEATEAPDAPEAPRALEAPASGQEQSLTEGVIVALDPTAAGHMNAAGAWVEGGGALSPSCPPEQHREHKLLEALLEANADLAEKTKELSALREHVANIEARDVLLIIYI